MYVCVLEVRCVCMFACMCVQYCMTMNMHKYIRPSVYTCTWAHVSWQLVSIIGHLHARARTQGEKPLEFVVELVRALNKGPFTLEGQQGSSISVSHVG
jgi:hypothetical protein